MKSVSIFSLINSIVQQLSLLHNQDLARMYAWWMLEAITKSSRSTLLAQQKIELSAEQEKTMERWIHEHTVTHKALAYILGSVPFLDLTILVRPPVLIPRTETEAWCAHLLTILQPYQMRAFNILDIGTGSGCIALGLAHACIHAHVDAIDIAPQAIALAQENARLNNINNITFHETDIFQDPLPAKYHMIVTNPPYISPHAYEHLDPSVKNWEDRGALTAANNGLAVILHIIKRAPDLLAPYTLAIPRLVIEIDHTQSTVVQHAIRDAGFSPEVWYDDQGKPRVIIGL